MHNAIALACKCYEPSSNTRPAEQESAKIQGRGLNLFQVKDLSQQFGEAALQENVFRCIK